MVGRSKYNGNLEGCGLIVILDDGWVRMVGDQERRHHAQPQHQGEGGAVIL
jgi:hypothetical protein